MWRVLTASLLLLAVLSCESFDRPDIDKLAQDGDSDRRGALPRGVLTSGGPYLELTVPACGSLNPAYVPPITTYEWWTIDGSVDPDSVRWILVNAAAFGDNYNQTLDYIRNNPDAPQWFPWQNYDPSADIGTRWTTPPTDFGRYVFAVHGKEADSTASQDFEFGRNAVRALVSMRTTGPVVTLKAAFMDSVVSAVPTTPLTVVELAGGTPVSFCWTADASAYCGVVTTYRYGWDILDLEDDSQWDVGFTTPYDGSDACSGVRTFYFGTHTFYVEVYDNSGFFARIPVKINYTPPPVVLPIDIQPDVCPNVVNPWSSGALWIAVLGSATFDVTDVDASSIRLNEVEHAMEGIGPGRYDVWDATRPVSGNAECNTPVRDPDGFDDLNLKFSLESVAELIGPGVVGDEMQFVLSGLLQDGTPFMAQDNIRIGGFEPIDDPQEAAQGPNTRIIEVLNIYLSGGQQFMEVVNIGDAEPDTVPMGSWLRLRYRGIPGPSDSSSCEDPWNNKCISFQKNFTWSASAVPGVGGTTNWLPVPPEDNDPYSTTDSTTMNIGTVDYTVRIRSVDEFGIPDPSPAWVNVIGNFRPELDDFWIEHHDGTVVTDGGSVVWDWWSPANYHGSALDTLDVSDPQNVYVVKDFYFLIRGSGHDHPKDGTNAGVKSWLYTFRRSDDPLFAQPFANSGMWTDAITVNTVCDTVWLHVRYSWSGDPGGTLAWQALPDWVHRWYDFEIRGRDTGSSDEFDQIMTVNGELHRLNTYNISPLGRTTRKGSANFYLTIVR